MSKYVFDPLDMEGSKEKEAKILAKVLGKAVDYAAAQKYTIDKNARLMKRPRFNCIDAFFAKYTKILERVEMPGTNGMAFLTTGFGKIADMIEGEHGQDGKFAQDGFFLWKGSCIWLENLVERTFSHPEQKVGPWALGSAQAYPGAPPKMFRIKQEGEIAIMMKDPILPVTHKGINVINASTITLENFFASQSNSLAERAGTRLIAQEESTAPPEAKRKARKKRKNSKPLTPVVEET